MLRVEAFKSVFDQRCKNSAKPCKQLFNDSFPLFALEPVQLFLHNPPIVLKRDTELSQSHKHDLTVDDDIMNSVRVIG